jgi:hypothetical protein
MNTRCKGILFGLSVIVAATATATSSIAWCFANQTHQQITEVAYAYLKAASECDFKLNPKAASFSAGNYLSALNPCQVVDIAAGHYAGSQPGPDL